MYEQYLETAEQVGRIRRGDPAPQEGPEHPQPQAGPAAGLGRMSRAEDGCPRDRVPRSLSCRIQSSTVTDIKRIEPRTLKGFRDYLPEAMIPRERLIDTARRVYRSYGFSPIDTPALEYLEILTGKGSDETDKQLYKFQDHGERWVGLRFDLTVPLARFAAQHIGQLGTPFKRYHIATVWRGENTQRGRYREFMQCDFDTIGTHVAGGRHRNGAGDPRSVPGPRHSTTSRSTSTTAMVLTRPARAVRPGRQDRPPILRALDKLAKIGREKVADEMVASAGATPEQADDVLRAGGDQRHERRRSVAARAAGRRQRQGDRRASPSWPNWSAAVRPPASTPSAIAASTPSIARGLDYYTGTIFETFLDQLARHRQRLLRRPLRQSGRAVHQAGTARHRRLAGSRSPAGGAGRAGPGAKR